MRSTHIIHQKSGNFTQTTHFCYNQKMNPDDFSKWNTAADDQFEAFLRDVARVENERAALQQRRTTGKLSPADTERLRDLNREARALLKTARQQGVLLPGGEDLFDGRRTMRWVFIIAGAVLAALVFVVGLSFLASQLGFVPILFIPIIFAFGIGFLVGREFPYRK
jgi:hypothetical protein